MSRRRTAARKWKLIAGLAGDDVVPAHGLRPTAAQGHDAVEVLITRSRKLRARGDARTATIVLRQACNLDEWRARTWTILGALLADEGRRDEAAQAFKTAKWLRARAGEDARAAVTQQLADRVAQAA